MTADPLDIDVLLYVALSEEFAALSSALEDDLHAKLHPTELPDLALQLFTVSVPSPVLKKEIRLAIVSAGKMGVTRAASIVSAILGRSRCNNVVVLGIAGSLSDDLQPGDVLIPDSVTEYFANSAAKNTEDQEEWKIETSGNSYATNLRLLNRFQHLKTTHQAQFEQWEVDCAKRYRPVATAEIQEKMEAAGFTMRDAVRIIAGDDHKLASGPTVGKSDLFVDWLKTKVDRKFVALEMESAGAYDAVYLREPLPRILAIRGISDFADERKKLIEAGTKGQFREVAAKNALSLLLRGIEAGFFEPAVHEDVKKKWTRIKQSSKEWIDQIHTALPNGLELPRAEESAAIEKAHQERSGGHILGESGIGKSALLKRLANNVQHKSEVVWIKAEHFSKLQASVPDLVYLLLETERPSGLLVIDSIENCYTQESIEAIGRFIVSVVVPAKTTWKVFISCQTTSWSRVSMLLLRSLGGHDVLAERIECGRLSDSDFQLFLDNCPKIRKLAQQRRLGRFLRSPKMLDLLLRNEPDFRRVFIGEADIVEWWWEEQVKLGKSFAGEEKIARGLAAYLADSLASEASPDAVAHDHESTDSLIKRQILTRTVEGRIRFDHDLLADWSRVMHLRSLGSDVLTFIREHSENPPWLRAVRLFSQHLLERASDHERWKTMVDSCKAVPPGEKEQSSQNLQILDAWLEGIAYCGEPSVLLEQNRAQLFENNAWLLERLIRRLLHNATIPDPVVQSQFRQIEPDTADYAALYFRFPVVSLWPPFIKFLIANPRDSTDCLPVTIAELGLLWGKLGEYLEINWSPLAELIFLNAEKELRREVAGAYSPDRATRSVGGGRNSRSLIYSAALKAASQNPERGISLALKAAGRKEWDVGDLTEDAEEGWRGEWNDRSLFGGRGSRVIEPIEAWQDGPRRSISRDFFQAWFEGTASLPLYVKCPNETCEVTLALLIDWPKTAIRKGNHDNESDRHGFHYEADRLGSAFWTKGPFIGYLRANWPPAVDLVVRLTNFATDRYEEWWPYDPGVQAVKMKTETGYTEWRGNYQVFGWNHYHMNTPQVVTCALMALERWFDERIEAGKPVSGAIEYLLRNGRSLSLVGVLICVGKRHPSLFTAELKPLLFVREFYNLDITAIRQSVGVGALDLEGEFMFNARREWMNLPGRRVWLRDASREWMLTKPEFTAVFKEVSSNWKLEAEGLPDGSKDRKELERWAVEFDPSLWSKTESEDGTIEAFNERLRDFQDPDVERHLNVTQALLTLPSQCVQILEKRQVLEPKNCEYIWDQLKNVEFWDLAKKLCTADSEGSEFMDGRHARAGMLAVITCLGEEWLENTPARFEFIDSELWKISNDPPMVTAYTAQDTNDDYEGFWARAAVRRWAANVNDPNWRAGVARLVTAYRYRTVQCLFDEAFRCRKRLGSAYLELEAFALSFSSIRKQSTKFDYSFSTESNTDIVSIWASEWIPKFAKGHGPRWTDDWASIESIKATPISELGSRLEARTKLNQWIRKSFERLIFRLQRKNSNKDLTSTPARLGHIRETPPERSELHRTEYGFDLGLILASFGHLPTFSDALDSDERIHWFKIARELLAAFHRTLPKADGSADSKWHYAVWFGEEKVFEIAAARLFETSKEEGREFWISFLRLPPAGHYYINQFLNAVLRESLRTTSRNTDHLTELWISFADFLAAQDVWSNSNRRQVKEVWKTILLFGSHFASDGDLVFAPVVQKLACHYQRFIGSIKHDSDIQSALAGFLTKDAASPIFSKAMVWFHDGWKNAKSYFWKTGIELRNFERLLDFCWRNRFEEISRNPEALASFKTLTLNLAAHNSATAIDIQNRIGGSETH
jgi:nucleoside phosphorylase